MPAPSVTYTFSNTSTADGLQVTQNFTDLVNALSNGTVTLNVGAITVNGTGALITATGSSAGGYNALAVNNTSATGKANVNFSIGSSGANGQAGIYYAPGTTFQIGPTGNDTTTPIKFVTNNGTLCLTLATDQTATFASTVTATLFSGSGASLTSLSAGNVSSGTLASARGGSGVSNSGTFTWGSNNITFTTAGATSVTLPTSGTLATLAGSEAFTNKSLSTGGTNTIGSTSITGTTGSGSVVFSAGPTLTGNVSAAVLVTPQVQNTSTTTPITALANTNGFTMFTGSATITIQGITAGVAGQRIIINNRTGNPMTLAHYNAGATAANRLLCPGSVDFTVSDKGAVELIYDNLVTGAWQVISK